MRKLVVLVLFLVLGDHNRYRANDAEIVTAFTAKQTCSCVFVMKRSEDFCHGFARQDPEVTTTSIDRETKSVDVRALGFWHAKARFLDPRRGCVVEKR